MNNQTQKTLFAEPPPKTDVLGPNFERTFDAPLAHICDAISSFKAGDRALKTRKIRKQMGRTLAAVRANPGSTSAELAAAMNTDRHQPARRLSQLERRGLVTKGQLKMCRICRTPCLSWWPMR